MAEKPRDVPELIERLREKGTDWVSDDGRSHIIDGNRFTAIGSGEDLVLRIEYEDDHGRWCLVGNFAYTTLEQLRQMLS